MEEVRCYRNQRKSASVLCSSGKGSFVQYSINSAPYRPHPLLLLSTAQRHLFLRFITF